MGRALTVNEAVALLGVEERVVRKEVEYGLFGSESPPRFKLPALVYLRVLRELGLQTTVEERRRIYGLIDKAFAQVSRPAKVEVSPVLDLKLAAATAEVQSILARFEEWKRKRVVVDPDVMGGEPVFKNHRLTVRHVGGLALKGTIDEIREDYPYLKPEDIEFARLYTVAYPKAGRPRARKTADR